MQRVENFFGEIDRLWAGGPEKVRLSIIGCGALMLQADYERGTKDSDVFETDGLTEADQRRLVELAGRGTALAIRHRLYLDIVKSGIPFLPRQPVWHPVQSLARLTNFEIKMLDVVDVVVTKLKRFSPSDIADIDAMIQLGRVGHEILVQRFRSAFEEFSYDARAAELARYVENLNRVERDMLGVEESEFDLDTLRD